MDHKALANADGDFLIVPQQGRKRTTLAMIRDLLVK